MKNQLEACYGQKILTAGKLDPDVLHSSPDNSFTIKPYSHPGSDYIYLQKLVKNGTASIEFPLEKPDAYITLRFQVFGTSIYFEGPNQEYLKTTNFEYDIYLDGEKIPAIIGTVGSIPNEKEGIWCKDTYHSDKIVQQGAKQHTCRMEIRNISAKNSPKPISVEINKNKHFHRLFERQRYAWMLFHQPGWRKIIDRSFVFGHFKHNWESHEWISNDMEF